MDVEDALNDGIVMLNDSISIPTSKSEYSWKRNISLMRKFLFFFFFSRWKWNSKRMCFITLVGWTLIHIVRKKQKNPFKLFKITDRLRNYNRNKKSMSHRNFPTFKRWDCR
jgi:hypothetical protein